MTFKIATDFDGVWTDPLEEAGSVRAMLVRETAAFSELPEEHVRADFEDIAELVRAEPHAYGWAPQGRITAYVDEDPFVFCNGLSGWVDRNADRDPRARRYREAILAAGEASLSEFADRCFREGTAAWREANDHALVDGAAEVLAELHGLGAELVVVSNSGPEKIVGWFRAAGVDAGVEDGAALRVRGNARKFTLGEGDEALTVGDRTVLVDRPHYRAFLEDERPDLVIGDVFSLDLALPHALRGRGADGAPSTLVLRRGTYTPAWVAEGRAGGAIDHVVDHVGGLVDVVRARLEATRSTP